MPSDDPIADAKRDLAVKVLAVVEAEERSRLSEGATGISSVVRDLCTAEGINLVPPGRRKSRVRPCRKIRS